MELEDHQHQHRELRHVCKFCSKSFGCGRSLGGHMRSHMINDTSALADGTKLTRKKLPPLSTYLMSNTNTNTNTNPNHNPTTKKKSVKSICGPGTPGYVLRENPRRSWKFSDHPPPSEDNSDDMNIKGNFNGKPPLYEKSCKECGKVFPSWKALFGHMKSHSIQKERFSNSLEEEEEEEQQDSWAIATCVNNKSSSNQKLVMDSQSDNETTAPSKKKRSKRRTRYMGPANSSSISFPNNASSSASAIEQEQEEVAMCLILLSRDVGQWDGLNSLASESSDYNSVSLGASPVITRSTEVKNSPCEVKVKSLGEIRLEEDGTKLGDRKPEFPDGAKNPKEDNQGESKEIGIGEADEVVPDSCKRKFIDSFDSKIKPETLKKFKALDGEGGSTKFECTTCNKVFHSYQALGGHRASHKKIKGCFASKVDSNENSIETESSPDQTSDSNKLANKSTTINEVQAEQMLVMDCEDRAETSKGTRKSKGHECPICLKVFPSGQALGGHKRAHLVGATNDHNHLAKANLQSIAAPPEPIILDLNLPAPVEEESNGLVGFNPWWLGSNHNCEPLLGLISN